MFLGTDGWSLRLIKWLCIQSSWCSNSLRLWLNSALKFDEIRLFSGDILKNGSQLVWEHVSTIYNWYLAGWTTFPMSERRSTNPLASFSSSNLDAELINAVLKVKYAWTLLWSDSSVFSFSSKTISLVCNSLSVFKKEKKLNQIFFLKKVCKQKSAVDKSRRRKHISNFAL